MPFLRLDFAMHRNAYLFLLFTTLLWGGAGAGVGRHRPCRK